MNVRATLRAATSPRHAELDGGFSALDVTKRADYATFLRGIAAAYLPVEARLKQGGIRSLFNDWAQRARGDALRNDLAALGQQVPLLDAPVLETPEAMLGALYVLEGSRLGGELLRRRVQSSLDAEVRGASRFLGHGEKAGLWQSFLARLESHPVDEAGIERMTRAADDTFVLFIVAAKSAFASSDQH
jgi:heme oxygenase